MIDGEHAQHRSQESGLETALRVRAIVYDYQAKRDGNVFYFYRLSMIIYYFRVIFYIHHFYCSQFSIKYTSRLHKY